MPYDQIAESKVSALQLDSPPIALSFAAAAPAGVQAWSGSVPSACSFWRRAESGVFFASAEQHFNCPIGAMVMGFEIPEAVQQDLMQTVGAMSDCGYVSPDEPAKIPTVKTKQAGIVYGPLKDFPLAPQLVLMWLSPRQAMLYSEATGSCRCAESSPTAAFGRPACAALPAALDTSQAVLSLGCLGMRTFTKIRDDRLLAVLPGSKLHAFAAALPSTLHANETMRGAYAERLSRFV